MCEAANKLGQEQAIRRVLSNSCDRLDKGDYEGFLALCAENFSYKITAYSPEIRREMIWLEKDRSGLEDLLRLLPAHNRDRRPITRHFAVFDVDYDGDGHSATVISGLQVFRTESDGGVTSLVAVGKYIDKVALEGEAPALMSRELRLQTRMLEIGFHEPL